MTRESKILNALCGKKVEILFFDGDLRTGVLRKDTLKTMYKIESLDNKNVIGYYLESPDYFEIHFKKSHVKSIKRCKK